MVVLDLGSGLPDVKRGGLKIFPRDQDRTPPLPNFAAVAAAAGRIARWAVRTPLVESPALSQRLGARVLLKLETLQRMNAFKFRGACNKIAQLDRALWPGGVVACSSGNHAQGVAEAARLHDLAAMIVMPRDAPPTKIARTRAAGAELYLYDRDSEDREAIAERLSRERRAALVPPYDDPDIIAGQGTAGLEIAEQCATLGTSAEMVLVPHGGGGLVAGIATALGHLSPDAAIYAVEPEGFDDLARSLTSGRRQRNAALSGSICDALLVRSPGRLTFEINRRRLAGALVVSDAQVRAAVRFAFETLRLVVEPGGAVGLAALLAGHVAVSGKTVVLVLSGGNIEPRLLCEILAGEGGDRAPAS